MPVVVLLVACESGPAPNRAAAAPTPPIAAQPQPQPEPQPQPAAEPQASDDFPDTRTLPCTNPLMMSNPRMRAPEGTDLPIRTFVASSSCKSFAPADRDGPQDVDLHSLAQSLTTKREFQRVLHCTPPAGIDFAHDRVLALSLPVTVTRVVMTDDKHKRIDVVVRFTEKRGRPRTLLVALPRDEEEGGVVACP